MLTQLSQALPTLSLSASTCVLLAVAMQLSIASGTPSPSRIGQHLAGVADLVVVGVGLRVVGAVDAVVAQVAASVLVEVGLASRS